MLFCRANHAWIRDVTRTLIGGGGVGGWLFIHILFMFCPTDFF